MLKPILAWSIVAGACVLVAGCASTSITQLSRNEAMISTSAAPVCHTSGAVSVANQSAAIATIQQGFSRFIILGYGAEDNTRLVSTGPTYATTNGTFNQFGSTVYGSATTTYGGQTTFVAGRNDAQLRIVMLNPGDNGYDQGLDAKQALGPDWEKKVKDGVPTCL
jgi:phage tail sheath gpL-like